MKNQAVASLIFLLSTIFTSVLPLTAFAALPAGFEVETVASGFTLPTAMTFVSDGRIFVAEKGGKVQVVKNGVLLPTPLIQLTDVNTYADRGLIGIAADPNFETNGYLYLLYTHENTPGANLAGAKTGRLVRVTVFGDTADESSKKIILGSVGGTLATPSCENYAVTSDCIPSDSPSHSVGGLRFGPDGKLYVTLGDGAHFEYVDPRAMRAQNLDSLAGKLLRINTDGTAPSDNPFYTGTSTDNRSKVYAYGLRNGFRLNFRPSNNALFVGDVGWSTWEEINNIVPGGNYGWPCREGNNPTTGYNCNVTPRIDPLYAYGHDVNGAGAVVAGAFATAYPAQYANSFFFGDYAQNWIKTATIDANNNLLNVQDFMSSADGAKGPVAVDRGLDGNIYYINIYKGQLNRILYTTGNRQPIAQLDAAPTNGLAPLTVNFSAASSTDPDNNPLTFNWDFGDGVTSMSTSPTHTYIANGMYTAVLTVYDGKGGQNIKSTNISVGNRAPTAVISTPTNGTLYRVGDTISLSGFGTDPEDGNITDPSKLVWTIILHHNTHIHILQTLNGTNPTFPAPDHQGSTDIYTEVQLSVTDSGGLTSTKSINLYLNNNPITTGNLIQNPSLETALSTATDTPQFWSRGGYGINDMTYTYPVVGFDGAKGAKVSMNQYTDGDAKWFHDPVSVTASTTYNFSGYYNGTGKMFVVVQIGYGTGSYTYQFLGALPSATNWTRVEKSFTTPAGAKTASVAMLLASVGQMSIDNFSLSQANNAPPSITITAPYPDAVVTGTSSMSADITSGSGVKDVNFYVDSNMIKTVTTFPYAFVWDSASVSNGNHSISALVHDNNGNTASTTPFTIHVTNQSSTTTSQNLISNPSVEAASTITAGTPQDWYQGNWGTNNAQFTYPSTGFDGSKAVQVNITNYTDGDAKWYFKDVPVTPGQTYNYSSSYQSTGTTSVVIRYKMSNGSFLYGDLAPSVSSSASWKKLSYSFTPQANTVSVTVFHLLSSVGTLTTDMFNISGPDTSTTTPPTSDNLIVNGSFEIASSTEPAGWHKGAWGTNTVNYGYPITGRDGKKAAQVTVTAYTDGDIKWMPDNIPMQIGKVYTFSSWYKSNTISDVIGRYTMNDGTYHYFGVKKELPPVADWSFFSATFTPPTSAINFTPLHLISSIGYLATDDVSLVISGNGTSTNDITPPVAEIISPAMNSIVSGNVTVVASSTDNVGVTGVMFAVDGIIKTGMIPPQPNSNQYSFVWDTTTVSNGPHLIKATTHDAAGNNSTGTSTLIVNNQTGTTTATTSLNLIANASLETVGGDGNPAGWNQDYWGTNTPVFTYPVSGSDGTKAAKVAMTSYTDGDAKWYFNHVAVNASSTYTYSNYYLSTVPTFVTAEYTMADGSTVYEDFDTVPTASAWTKYQKTFTVPANVVSLSVFHHLDAIGELTVDQYSLVKNN